MFHHVRNEMLDTPQSVCRVRVVGDPGVGKSSLISRFVSGHFSQVIDPITLCTIVLSRSVLIECLLQFKLRRLLCLEQNIV